MEAVARVLSRRGRAENGECVADVSVVNTALDMLRGHVVRNTSAAMNNGMIRDHMVRPGLYRCTVAPAMAV